jgi:VanZ family protein
MRKIKTVVDFLYDEVLITNQIITWLVLIGWMGMIFYLSSIPDLSFTGRLATYDFVLRKLSHMFVFGVLAILWHTNIKSYGWSGVLAFLYAISDELHQQYVPTRRGAVTDIVIDTVGIVIALYLLQWVLHRLEEPEMEDEQEI